MMCRSTKCGLIGGRYCVIRFKGSEAPIHPREALELVHGTHRLGPDCVSTKRLVQLTTEPLPFLEIGDQYEDPEVEDRCRYIQHYQPTEILSAMLDDPLDNIRRIMQVCRYRYPDRILEAVLESVKKQRDEMQHFMGSAPAVHPGNASAPTRMAQSG